MLLRHLNTSLNTACARQYAGKYAKYRQTDVNLKVNSTFLMLKLKILKYKETKAFSEAEE